LNSDPDSDKEETLNNRLFLQARWAGNSAFDA